ncbi:MAG: hypothetical protein M0006_12400 [Magnetospirillum sp.]|nr:hypothetical protein [Magnetospirillum sp.]
MAKRFDLGANGWQRLELDDRAPKGDLLAQLVEMGFSADWLLTGAGRMRRDGQPSLDERLLADTVRMVEDWLAANRATMTAARKAEIVASLYAMVVEDVAEGRPPPDAKRVAHILKLAG